MRTLAFALLLALSAPAFAGPTGVAADLPEGLAEWSEELVREWINTPNTANFRKIGGFALSDGGWAVCGEVNYRGITGLALGWKPIFLRFRSESGGLALARRIVDWPADVACRRLAMGRALRTRD
jgi:hypothetical protein